MNTTALTLGIIACVGVFNENIMNLIKTMDRVDVEAIKFIMIVAIVIYVVYNIAYYLIGKRQLEKGVNVD